MQNNFGSQGNIVKTIPVVFAPKQETMYRNIDSDPQDVISREPHAAIVRIDTKDLPAGVSRVNFVISNNVTYMSNTSRIEPVRAEFYNLYIPNVNERNNEVTFFSSVSGLFHTVIVPLGFYNVAEDAMGALVLALNTVTGASGLTFSKIAATNFPDTWGLESAGGDFYIKDTCNAITHGYPMWGIQLFDQTARDLTLVGPISLRYTWWIDICSTTLTKFAKKRSITSSGISDVFARMNITSNNFPVPWGDVYENFGDSEATFAFNPMETITSVDIQLRDMFGDILYVEELLNKNLLFSLEFKSIL